LERADAAERGEAALVSQTTGVAAGSDQECGGDVRADAELI
jgi:hypothetical protein